MGLLEGKRALIVGVASNRSIAWGIARAMHREGAELAFTYQNDKLRARVEKFAADCHSDITIPCDVGDDGQIIEVFAHLDDYWDSLDILIHSVAFAPKEQLEGEYLEHVTRAGFLQAHDISSYSFCALGDAARPYNVMGVAKASLEANVRYMAASLGPEGIRVNAISAGPIRTLAASGIKGLRGFLSHVAEVTPLRRNVTIDEVGNTAAFLCSDHASAITGEITYVDCGYNSVGAS